MSTDAGVLGKVLALMPCSCGEAWTGNEAIGFAGGWRRLKLPELTGLGWEGKELRFQTSEIAEVSRTLGLSGRADVGITLEHHGYRVRIVRPGQI